eukprot:14622553-Alexandrium_andersonii.AAC.1
MAMIGDVALRSRLGSWQWSSRPPTRSRRRSLARPLSGGRLLTRSIWACSSRCSTGQAPHLG